MFFCHEHHWKHVLTKISSFVPLENVDAQQPLCQGQEKFTYDSFASETAGNWPDDLPKTSIGYTLTDQWALASQTQLSFNGNANIMLLFSGYDFKYSM